MQLQKTLQDDTTESAEIQKVLWTLQITEKVTKYFHGQSGKQDRMFVPVLDKDLSADFQTFETQI